MSDHIEAQAEPQLTRLDKLIIDIGEAIYAIRWGLVPMYIGLWIAVLAYNIQFFRETLEFMFVGTSSFPYFAFKENDATSFLLWVLNLIDITMIANLVVMITVGGFSTFVREYDLKHLVGRPRWMNGLDSSTLKIKMSMSLVGVSAIYLLKTFMEVEHVSWDTVLKVVLIHVVFIGTTLAFSFNSKLMPKHGAPDSHDSKPHS